MTTGRIRATLGLPGSNAPGGALAVTRTTAPGGPMAARSSHEPPHQPMFDIVTNPATPLALYVLGLLVATGLLRMHRSFTTHLAFAAGVVLPFVVEPLLGLGIADVITAVVVGAITGFASYALLAFTFAALDVLGRLAVHSVGRLAAGAWRWLHRQDNDDDQDNDDQDDDDHEPRDPDELRDHLDPTEGTHLNPTGE